MPPPVAIEKSVESAWRKIRRRLSQVEGFAFMVVFVEDIQLIAPLKRSVQHWLLKQGSTLTVISDRNPDGFADRSISELFGAIERASHGVLWLEAHRGAGQTSWDQSRSELLGLLNERRSRLESEAKGPLVLLLPKGAEREVAARAPDLWHARYLSEVLRASGVTEVAGWIDRYLTDQGLRLGVVSATPDQADQAKRWLKEWRKYFGDLQHSPNVIVDDSAYRIDVDAGLVAAEGALEEGSLADAVAISERLVFLTRAREAAASAIPTISPSLQAFEAHRLRSRVLDAMGEHKEALVAALDALESAKRATSAMRDRRTGLRLLGMAWEGLRFSAIDAGDLKLAGEAASEALKIWTQMLKEFGAALEVLEALKMGVEGAGLVAQRQGNLAEAERHFSEGLSIARRCIGMASDSSRSRLDAGLAVSLLNLASTFYLQGEPNEAIPLMKEAIETFERLIEEQPGDQRATADLVSTISVYASILQSAGQEEAAIAEFRRSLLVASTSIERGIDTMSFFIAYKRAVDLARASGLLADEDIEQHVATYIGHVERRFPGVANLMPSQLD